MMLLRWSLPDPVKPQVDEIEFPNGSGDPSCQGTLVNLDVEPGAIFCHVGVIYQSGVGADQRLGRVVINMKTRVYTLPRHLDEKVAALHLAKVGASLSTLRPDQADYIGVEQQGPFKANICIVTNTGFAIRIFDLPANACSAGLILLAAGDVISLSGPLVQANRHWRGRLFRRRSG